MASNGRGGSQLEYILKSVLKDQILYWIYNKIATKLLNEYIMVQLEHYLIQDQFI